jgi:hypothetical protein
VQVAPEEAGSDLKLRPLIGHTRRTTKGQPGLKCSDARAGRRRNFGGRKWHAAWCKKIAARARHTKFHFLRFTPSYPLNRLRDRLFHERAGPILCITAILRAASSVASSLPDRWLPTTKVRLSIGRHTKPRSATCSSHKTRHGRKLPP